MKVSALELLACDWDQYLYLVYLNKSITIILKDETLSFEWKLGNLLEKESPNSPLKMEHYL